MIKKLGFALLLAAVSGAAFATRVGGNPTAAPEIDPASAMTGLTLVLGGLAVLRGRLKRGR